MRVHHGLTVLCVLAAASGCQQSSANASASIRTEVQKESYAVGANIGQQMQPSAKWIDTRALERGFEDALAGRDLAVPKDSLQGLVQSFARSLNKDITDARVQVAGKNLAAGKAYLAENAKKPGVKVTKDGLQYQVLQEGKGPHPTASDQVTVQYKGMFINGKVFDSSYQRGQPATFDVEGVIPGFSEGLKLMRVGSKYRFVIPPDLAYGATGRQGGIGPDETLVFEVDLLKIEPVTPAAPASKPGAKKK